MLSIAPEQGVNESLDDSAKREALKKETPEQAAARLRAESKDLRQSVRYGARALIFAETGTCVLCLFCGWRDVSTCCPLRIPPGDGSARRVPPWRLLCGITDMSYPHLLAFSHIVRERLALSIMHRGQSISKAHSKPDLHMQGCSRDRPGAEAETYGRGGEERRQEAEWHDVSSPG